MDSMVCRICLNNMATISVFDVQDGIQHSAKIMRCTSIVIAEDDGLPSTICSGCVDELAISYQFLQKCLTSDNTLRERCIELPYDVCDNHIKDEEIKAEQDHYHTGYLGDDQTLNNELVDNDYKSKKEQKEYKSNRKKHRTKIKKEKLGPLPCAICGLMVSSPSAMDIHLRTHTGEKPFVCDFCNCRYPTKGSLKRHKETHHTVRERKFTCETCGHSFFRKNDIVIHMRVHTDERPYICPYCSKKFRQIASLTRHKRVHTREKPYSCPVCNKNFADKSLVKKHLLVHTDEKKFSCHLCSKSMKSKNALTTHLRLHNNEKQNICSFCGMAFSMKGNLQTHIRRVHSEKSGQCSVCMKTFSDLEAHMRKHTGEKPFVCEVCKQAFGTKRSLAHHVVFRHENAAKFNCSVGDCTKTFPTATMLEFHLLKLHTNHTPYICQQCSRGFFRMSDLTRHLRVTHNIDTHIKMPIKIKINDS